MRTLRSRFLAVLPTTLLATLCVQCGSVEQGQEEPLGQVQQELSCNTAADCSSLVTQCVLSVQCYKRFYYLPGTCVVVNKTNGTSCDDDNACTQTDTCQSGACVGADPLPPQESCWGHAVDPALPTSLYDATKFLWDGVGTVQQGVASGTIDPERAGVIRGRVVDRDGDALHGVTISIVGHTEFGSTEPLGTQGWFDMRSIGKYPSFS